MTLDEAIAHFDDVSKFLELGGKGNGSTHRDIARYLKRLKYLEEKIANGELVEVKNEHSN